MAAKKFLTIVAGVKTLMSALTTSSGAGDEGNLVALNTSGKIDETMMPAGIGADTCVANASENLAAGDMVNLWDDAGTLKVRKADATAAGKECDGFVSGAVTSGDPATVILDGTLAGLTGLTIGAHYYLGTTAGAIVTTAPSATNNVYQGVGKAKSATELVFERGEPITIAA
ncbi:MAG: hypothetical protein ABL994_16865 [Verrucomicrobiales bacterium]